MFAESMCPCRRAINIYDYRHHEVRSIFVFLIKFREVLSKIVQLNESRIKVIANSIGEVFRLTND